MPASEQRKTQHLLWRAGFGPGAEALKPTVSREETLDKLFVDADSYTGINIVNGLPVKNEAEFLTLPKDKKVKLFVRSREEIKQLNIEWFNKMLIDGTALREKMTLFWHGHFANRLKISYFAQQQNNTLRKNSLGKFSDLLMEISKDPGMLQFLNNQQNKKGSPNENFAREVMELFTLGRGNYTEEDIKNAARAFTGWGFNFAGEFVFRVRQHDYGPKTFAGKTGNFTGEDILEMILTNKQCARFITTKVYKFFVNDNPDNLIIESLADGFYNNGYDIAKLMKTIFSSDWFYDEKNIGAKIKSPIELLVGMNKTFGITYGDERVNLFNQRMLNQVLFVPPNVAGWPGGKAWIDSSSLMYRMKLPELIFTSAELNVNPKDDPSTEGGEGGMMGTDAGLMKKLKQVDAKINWVPFISLFSNKKRSELFQSIFTFLLQTEEKKLDEKMVEGFVNASTDEEYVKSLSIKLISLPDYQMC